MSREPSPCVWAGDLSMKMRIVKIGIICIFVLILLDFIPIRFAVKNNVSETVFITQPKLGNAEWVEIELDGNKLNYSSMTGYIIEGSAPDKMLNQRDFDKVSLHLMRGDNINRFIIHYDEKEVLNDNEVFPIYKTSAIDWEILYPIHRASFRRFYASKEYLTIYDFNLINLISQAIK